MNQDLIEIQSKLSFQEDTINALSDEVAKQSEQIAALKLQLKILNEKLNDTLSTGGEKTIAANSPPPHY